jgi:hypothetical protein
MSASERQIAESTRASHLEGGWRKSCMNIRDELPHDRKGSTVMNQLVRRNRSPLLLAGIAALAALAVSLPHAAVAASRTSYILFAPASDSVSMSGSMDDIRRARALRAGKEAMLYVRQGGAAYVIRDPETLRAARALFQPQEALGAQQAELGSRQAELGSRQAALGRQQEELGRRQDALGQQQDALGRQQDALGREQDRLARIAEEKLQALVADAIQRGIARRVD